jgi:hypothetical protein
MIVRCAALVLCLACVVALTGCTGCGTVAADASAPDGSADGPGCSFTMCDGATVICAPGTSCPVGDGCNRCDCQPLDSGYPLVCVPTKLPCDCATWLRPGETCNPPSPGPMCCSAVCLDSGVCQ